MAYRKCSIMADGDLSVCSGPSVVPGPEWMFREGLLEEGRIRNNHGSESEESLREETREI